MARLRQVVAFSTSSAIESPMDFLLYLAIIPMLGITAQWIAWRTNLPSILLLLLFGVALGHFIKPDELLAELTEGSLKAGPELLFPIVSLSVAVIMFEGGLSLKLSELKEAGTAAFALCTVGAMITWLGVSAAAHLCLEFSWQVSFLLGAVLVVTGPTVIGPLLRQVRPSKRVAATLKWEGIVIDPIGAVLAVLVFEEVLVHSGQASIGSAIGMLVRTAAIGTALGILGGFLLTHAFRRFWMPDHLHGVGSLGIGMLLFAISNHFAHESGLIAVTVLGIWLANQHHFEIEHIVEFKENLRTLLIGCLFVVLGSRVDLADVAALGFPGLAFLAILILVVRPISVFVSLMGSKLDFRERAFIAGLAPRGIVAAAVSSVFALKLEQSTVVHLPDAEQIATVTFLVIVGSVAIYGLAATPLARWLHLADEKNNGVLIAGAEPWVRDFAIKLSELGIPAILVDTNFNKVSQANIAGVKAKCTNILSELASEEISMTGIGKFLAMTPNDEVNSMAIRQWRSIFGRAGVYQLNFTEKNSHERRGLTKNLMGRVLFSKELTFSAIRDQHEHGATFKSTTLSNEFLYQDFLQKYDGSAQLLCVLDADDQLTFNTIANPISPGPGDTVIALVR